MKRVLIIGATSAIAEQWQNMFTRGDRIYLVARNEDRLSIAADLRVRGA